MTASLWRYSLDHNQLCQVIDSRTLWGKTTFRVWLPESDSVVRVSGAGLVSPETTEIGNSDNISYLAAPARVADVLTRDILPAQLEEEERMRRKQINDRSNVMPDLYPLLILGIGESD